MSRGCIAMWACVVAGCAMSHERDELRGEVDAGVPRTDARVIDGGEEPVRELATWELPASFGVWDTIATIDGDVCVAGNRTGRGDSALLPDVDRGDAFVACFALAGLTRSRIFSCDGAAFGATRLASHDAGDVFVLLEGDCVGVDRATAVQRLDRGLATRAQLLITSTGDPPAYVRAIAVSDRVVMVGGSHRVPGRVGAIDAHGPFAAVLSADDLSVTRVLAREPEAGVRYADVDVAHVAVRGAVALLFGRDVEGGVFTELGGPFARTVALPDGGPIAVGDERWHHRYEALFHPDGRPVLLGTRRGSTRLRIQLAEDARIVDTGYGGSPDAAFRGNELLVARPLLSAGLEIAGRSLSADDWGGALIALDAESAEPIWARGLARDYRHYDVAVTPDGTIAVVARDPVFPEQSGMILAFYR